MSVFGKFTVEISDDARYEKGKTYDLALSSAVVPDPSSVMTGTVSPAPVDVTATELSQAS